jgi:hypothetical protein
MSKKVEESIKEAQTTLYLHHVSRTGAPGFACQDEQGDTLVDLLSGLIHLAESSGLGAVNALSRAVDHYNEEVHAANVVEAAEAAKADSDTYMRGWEDCLSNIEENGNKVCGGCPDRS